MKKKRQLQLRRIAAMHITLSINGEPLVDVSMEELYLIAVYGHEGKYGLPIDVPAYLEIKV